MSRLALCVAGVLVAAQPALAEDPSRFLSGGKYAVEARYRLETVDQDGFAEGATANTIRFRQTLTSGVVGGFSAVVEADDLESVTSAGLQLDAQRPHTVSDGCRSAVL